MNHLPRRSDGAFDGEGYFPRNLDVLADESEIGRSLRDRRRPVAAHPGEPDIVDIGQVAGHANRRRHDRGQVPVESKVPQRLLQDLRTSALIHAFADKIAVALRIQAIAPPDARARRLANDLWLVKDRQRHNPGRVLQSYKASATRLAAGERTDLLDELGAFVRHRES